MQQFVEKGQLDLVPPGKGADSERYSHLFPRPSELPRGAVAVQGCTASALPTRDLPVQQGTWSDESLCQHLWQVVIMHAQGDVL